MRVLLIRVLVQAVSVRFASDEIAYQVVFSQHVAAKTIRLMTHVHGWNQSLLLILIALHVVAVLLHLLPGTVQQNQAWLLFALPCWLSLAWCLRRRR